MDAKEFLEKNGLSCLTELIVEDVNEDLIAAINRAINPVILSKLPALISSRLIKRIIQVTTHQKRKLNSRKKLPKGIIGIS